MYIRLYTISLKMLYNPFIWIEIIDVFLRVFTLQYIAKMSS